MKKIKRKHWSEYVHNDTCYGNWRMRVDDKIYPGFGVYLINGKDAWLDEDCATPSEKRYYRAYCKVMKFTKEESRQ